MNEKIIILIIIILLIINPILSAVKDNTYNKMKLITLDKGFDENHLKKEFNNLRRRRRRRQLRTATTSSTSNDHNNVHNNFENNELKIHHKFNFDHHIEDQNERRSLILVEIDEVNHQLITEINGVIIVEDDGPVWIDNEQSTMHKNGQLWHLDRIDSTFGLDGKYEYDNSYQGSGIDLYVVDTGVYKDHSDFGGRVLTGRDTMTVPGVFPGNIDCNGHGTHVASIAAGSEFGIAKKATIIPVKVVDCDGRGTVSALIRGIEYAVDTQKNRKKKSVINISLSAGKTISLNNAVKSAVNAGLIVAVAAGNSKTDACNYSPASETSAFTIGGLSSDDSRLSISNYGNCVDIYAPGDMILAAGIANKNSVALKRGTSMASPNAAGIAVIYWDKYSNLDNEQIMKKIIDNSVKASESIDQDCQNNNIPINPNRIVQSIVSPKVTGNLKGQQSYLAAGNDLDNDFFDWHSSLQLSTLDNKGDSCIIFDAQLKATYRNKPKSSAKISIGFSSQPNPYGFWAYEHSADSCKNKNLNYYSITVGGNDNAEIKTRNKATIKTSVNKHSNLIDYNVKKTFYARVTNANTNGIKTIQIGTGSNPGNNILITANHNPSNFLEKVQYISLSANYDYDIEYSNIRKCSAGNGNNNNNNPTPTPAPTQQATNGGGNDGSAGTDITKSLTHLVKKKSGNGIFSKFWEGSTTNSNICYEFTVKGPKNLLISLSETADPFYFADPNNKAYTILVGGKSKKKKGKQIIKHNGEEILTEVTKRYLSKKKFIYFRIEKYGSTIKLFVRNPVTDMEFLVFGFTDDENIVNTKYLSLSTYKSYANFKSIKKC